MAFQPLDETGFAALTGFLAPAVLPPVPATLPVADATLVELVRLAVLGPAAPTAYLQAFPAPEDAAD